MKKEIISYFENLKNNKDLPKSHGKFAEDGIKIRKLTNGKYDVSHLVPFRFGDDLMCVKEHIGEEWKKGEIMEIISGDYFNSLKIPSVVGYPISLKFEGEKMSLPAHGVATHHLAGISGIEYCNGESIIKSVRDEIINERRLLGIFPAYVSVKDDWMILDDALFRSKLLELMTPECLDDFIGLFVADKLGTYGDRHGLNYFFYKKAGHAKWEGVIAIDNEAVADFLGTMKYMSEIGYNVAGTFEEFCFTTQAPQGTWKGSTHGQNMREMRDYLERGKFNKRHEEVIKGALEYPFADNMKKTCEEYEIHLSPMLYDDVSRLWEYNREIFKDV